MRKRMRNLSLLSVLLIVASIPHCAEAETAPVSSSSAPQLADQVQRGVEGNELIGQGLAESESKRRTRRRRRSTSGLKRKVRTLKARVAQLEGLEGPAVPEPYQTVAFSDKHDSCGASDQTQKALRRTMIDQYRGGCDGDKEDCVCQKFVRASLKQARTKQMHFQMVTGFVQGFNLLARCDRLLRGRIVTEPWLAPEGCSLLRMSCRRTVAAIKCCPCNPMEARQPAKPAPLL